MRFHHGTLFLIREDLIDDDFHAQYIQPWHHTVKSPKEKKLSACFNNLQLINQTHPSCSNLYLYLCPQSRNHVDSYNIIPYSSPQPKNMSKSHPSLISSEASQTNNPTTIPTLPPSQSIIPTSCPANPPTNSNTPSLANLQSSTLQTARDQHQPLPPSCKFLPSAPAPSRYPIITSPSSSPSRCARQQRIATHLNIHTELIPRRM